MPLEVKSNHEPVKPTLRMEHRLDSRRHRESSSIANVDKPYINRHHDSSKRVNQNQWLGSKENKEDELVKYMSNLPGYLQNAEKGKNIQGKALNFGVLDWERLEQWKYNERMPARFHRKTLSGSSSIASGKPPIAHDMSSQKKKMPSPGCESSFEQKHGKHKQIPRKEIPSRRRNSDLSIGKYYRGSDTGRKMRSDEGNLFSEQIKNVNVPSQHTNSSQDCKSEIKLGNGVNLISKTCATEPKNIVLLVPKHRPKTSMEASEFSESRTFFDEQPTAMSTTFSDCSSQESYSTEQHAVPHSCPLPASFAMNAESQLSNAQNIKSDLCSSPSQNERVARRASFDSKYLKDQKSDAELDSSGQAVLKGRHPSPNKRFSFCRISRSFSFKETSSVSPVDTTTNIPKSGPVNCGTSSSVDIGTREKPSGGIRGRSSPLRRLLDPLLRLKGVHSAETHPLPNGNFNGKTLPTSQLNMKKHQPSTLQALVQLTLKDGVPFFKLVVDDDGGILAAAVKKLPTSGKGGSSLVYAFYAVHEIKRKSGGWMSQGPKEKSAGFGYKVIGQMEISCSNVVNDGENISLQRESVLYSIDSGQVDKQVADSCKKIELAAVVVMNSNQNQIYADSSTLDQYKQGMQHLYGEVVVILPGGTHSLPSDGAPSSLLERWRSGGICDCGGWDVGCKLKVLELNKNHSNQDYLSLFLQGGDRRSKPVFSMAPLKNGLHSVEFDSSIPLLEAFSICVSALTSHKLADIFEMGSLLGQKAMNNTATTVQGQVPQRYVPSPPPSPVGRI